MSTEIDEAREDQLIDELIVPLREQFPGLMIRRMGGGVVVEGRRCAHRWFPGMQGSWMHQRFMNQPDYRAKFLENMCGDLRALVDRGAL